EKNTPADLAYLFNTRRTVASIQFGVPDAEVLRIVRQAMSVSSGSTTLSALQNNRVVPGLDSQINAANLRLVQNTCAVNAIRKNPFTYPNLQTTYGCANQSIQLTEPTLPR